MSSFPAYLPVLFLDFDGVLHANNPAPGERWARLPLLAQALAGREASIVISSSWRFHVMGAALCASFPEDLRRRVVGVTGPAHVGRHARWHEIGAYVRAQGIANWRALDDAHYEFPPGCPELIGCDGGRGLDAPQVAALERWLDGPD